MKNWTLILLGLGLAACGGAEEPAAENTMAEAPAAEASSGEEALCLDAGPQTPRDISNSEGLNTVTFPFAPPATEMNLCNIHTHTNAEHKGPDFSVFVNDTDSGGYACNATADLTEAELAPAAGAYGGVAPGDTIEVHWVHTTCDATPGAGLGACVPESCTDPLLRVEAQVFLVVNDPNALNFMDMAYAGNVVDGRHQALAIPSDTGEPVLFRGSTTGPSYTQQVCSPAQVTWSVRPNCAKVDINSLHAWAESGNAFEETKSHGVRQLVTAPELLSTIEQ
ncbi:MAG: delta-class carbonic anhydrase [Woeseiaceae bacterium]|nr:delta-class carbonic anhydrase [Woeseiaceae bacterium]